jgi:hypothetical protein
MDYFEHMDLYPPRRYEPRSDSERTDYILSLLQSDPATLGSPAADAADYGGAPSVWLAASESQRGAGVYRREYLPPDPPRDAIRSLGDEMVLLAAGLGGAGALARGLPYAAQIGRQGIASLTALSAEAAEAAAAVSRSFMNRLGRLPTAKELVEALGPTKILSEGAKSNANPMDYSTGWSPSSLGAEGMPPQDSERWSVSHLQQILGELEDNLRGLGGRTFQSYTKKQLDLLRYYAGLTSGTRSPDENVLRRDAAKFPSPNYEPAELDRSSNRYSSIRGREQQLIEHFRKRRISNNRRNSIGPRNRLKNYYMRNAESEFGRIPDSEDEE